MIQRFFLVLWALWVCCSPSPSSSPGRSSGPRLPPPPPLSVPMRLSSYSAPTQADGPRSSHSGASILVRVMEQHDTSLEQWWTTAQALGKIVRQMIHWFGCPIAPHDPWVFPLAYKSPVPCSFVIKSVQQKADHFTQSHECVNSHLPLICIFKAFYLFLWVQLLFTSWRHFRLHLADGSSSEGNWVRGGRRASWFGRDPSLLLDIFWSLDSQAASNTTGKAGPGLSCLLNTGGRDKR